MKEEKKRVINLAGETNLLELAAFMEKCDLFISNDSGPLHLATAMDVRTVSFFGPETPALYGPRGKKHSILYKKLPCSPCITVYNNKTVRCPYDSRCLKTIEVDEAFKIVEQKLKQIKK